MTGITAEVVIIGSGAGGGTLAYALAREGVSVLLLERGESIPSEDDNWQANAGAFGQKYRTERSVQFSGRAATTRAFFHVGGETKVYGAALYRLREQDFERTEHPDGFSPAWPIRYDDLEPFYGRAEQVYRVHGEEGDTTEPPRSRPYAHGPVPMEPPMQALAERLALQGIPVSTIPRAIDLGPDGRCQYCTTCDVYPCRVGGKLDAEVACVEPALATGNLELLTRARCDRLIVRGGRVEAAEVEIDGRPTRVTGKIWVASCGVLESPALLLRSANEDHPAGLANSSGLVGRNLCGHNAQIVMPIVLRRVPPMHQKSFALNGYYSAGPGWPYPLGVLQSSGQIPMWREVPRLVAPFVKLAAQHGIATFAMNEVLPEPENRVSLLPDGRLRIDYKSNNLASFRKLRAVAVRTLRKAGYPLVLAPPGPISGMPWHPAGTLRFGVDPTTSVLDPHCKVHDLENLYAVDASFLPSAGAINTSLTVMAQAFRTADHIVERLRGSRPAAR